MAVIKMNIHQWTKHLEKLGERFEPAMRRGMLSGAQRLIPVMQTRTIQAPPASPNGSVGAYDLGLYRMAWRASPEHYGARIYNLRPYSPVIERGRRPAPVGRTGLKALEAWAHRKLHLPAEEARSAAFAIATTLAKKRLRARKVMSSNPEELTRIVEEEITRELDEELTRR